VWLTLQGNWNENDVGDALDTTCNKLLNLTMQHSGLSRLIVRLTEIDNRERQVTTVCRADGAVANAPAPSAPSPVTASYDAAHGGYIVDGVIDGNAAHFLVDTGASGTSINSSYFRYLRPEALGWVTASLADGSLHKMMLYRVRNVCIAAMCVGSLEVTFADNAPNLLGADFIQAAHVSLTINNGVMTLSSNS
jgi:predicted aspartyl protease